MNKKHVFPLACVFLGIVILSGCAPKQAYMTADALGQTSSIAGSAAESARRNAGKTDATRNQMVNDIHSIKEAEKLFDEKSGIILSY